jgi:hypothetical protein
LSLRLLQHRMRHERLWVSWPFLVGGAIDFYLCMQPICLFTVFLVQRECESMAAPWHALRRSKHKKTAVEIAVDIHANNQRDAAEAKQQAREWDALPETAKRARTEQRISQMESAFEEDEHRQREWERRKAADAERRRLNSIAVDSELGELLSIGAAEGDGKADSTAKGEADSIVVKFKPCAALPTDLMAAIHKKFATEQDSTAEADSIVVEVRPEFKPCTALPTDLMATIYNMFATKETLDGEKTLDGERVEKGKHVGEGDDAANGSKDDATLAFDDWFCKASNGDPEVRGKCRR